MLLLQNRYYAAAIIAAETKQRFREGRQRAAREIREAQNSGVVTGFRLLVSANDCDVCQAAQHKFFPVETCTAEMLPPYENCKIPEGCRATFTGVLGREYKDLLAKYPPGTASDSQPEVPSKPKLGCSGATVAVCVFSSIAAWMFTAA
jgi:hypothetical protein